MSEYDEVIASYPMVIQVGLIEMAWGLSAIFVIMQEQTAKDAFRLWWIDTKTSCSGISKVLACLIFSFCLVSLGYQILDCIHIESIYIIFPCMSVIKNLLAGASIDLAKIGTIYISFAPPLYYFYFKEQRAVSESFMTDVEVSISNIFMVCCIGNGLLFIDKENKIDTVFDFIYMMILALWIVIFIRSLTHRLRPKLLMEKAINEAVECLSIILADSNGKIQIGNHEQALYRRLDIACEIYYQILAYGIQKNINEIIEKGIKTLEIPFGMLRKIIEVKAEDISPNEPIYSSIRFIFRNHKNFCISLYEDKRNVELQDALQLFFKYYPKELDLKDDKKNLIIIDEYFKTYWSMLLYFINNNRNMFQSVADKMLSVHKLDNEATDIVLTLRALIINAVDEDNLTHMIETCYLQKKLVDNIRISEKISKEKDFFSRVNNGSEERRSQNYEGIQLYVLFQAIIKSTELSQYKMVGFLVKYIVSNYKTDMINSVYKNVLKNRGYIDARLHEEIFFERLGVKFNINKDTVVYCLKKVVILLRLQEMYLSNISEEEMIPLKIFANKKDRFSFQYCMNKVLLVKEQYGMACLYDENKVWKLQENIYSNW